MFTLDFLFCFYLLFGHYNNGFLANFHWKYLICYMPNFPSLLYLISLFSMKPKNTKNRLLPCKLDFHKSTKAGPIRGPPLITPSLANILLGFPIKPFKGFWLCLYRGNSFFSGVCLRAKQTLGNQFPFQLALSYFLFLSFLTCHEI